MEELEKMYEDKNNEMKEKYKDVIYKIAEKYDVDLGQAFDMLKAVPVGGVYAEGIELDLEALKEDYKELEAISKKIEGMKG